MNVIINVDVLEKIESLHLRRAESEKCIYALLIGTVEGFNTYHITDCVYRFIFFNEKYKENGDEHKVRLIVLNFL